MAKKNEVYLDFCIWDFEDITHDELTNLIGIEPVKIYIKGEKVNPKLILISKKNGWRMSSPHDKYTSFEEQMNSLLDIIEAKIEVFKSLASRYYCEFSCALYVYSDNEESTPSVHLDSRYNRVMKEVNIEFDLDLYCL